MTIIRAENRHIPELIRLLYQVGGVHHELRPDLFRANSAKYAPVHLEFLLTQEDSPIFVAEEGDALLGYCFCQLREYESDTILTDRKEIYIDDLCVDESCRRQGTAKALYDYVCAWAKEIGCSYVTLNVWCGNDGAMKFYEKMGMTKRSITMETKL